MNWLCFAPELTTFLGGMVCLGMALFPKQNARDRWHIAWLLSLICLVVTAGSVAQQGVLFHDVYSVDLFSQIFKVALSLGLFLVLCLCTELKSIQNDQHAETYALLFFCTLAMMLLVSSTHLLTLYLSLELSSYSLYILVALRRRPSGLEAGLKYFLIGVFSSAVMLFGMALLYGLTKATFLSEMAQILPDMVDEPLVILALGLTLCGFLFKLGVFPFHFWAPDAYQGAANQVTAYIAAVSKIAAIAVIARVIAAMGPANAALVPVLIVISIISTTLGNLAAIAQQDLKRLLAYSTIAQGGYVMIGLLSMTPDGYASASFYALAWVIMKFTVFLVIVKVAHDGSNLTIPQLAGLHRRAPILALALMVAVFSLAGIPPTIGFTGKFLLFIAAVGKGYLFLVLIAMINVVISLYYYLLILKAAYLTQPEDDPGPLNVAFPIKAIAIVLILIMVVAGFYPAPLIELTSAAVASLMQ